MLTAELFISDEISAIEAMKRLDEAGLRIVFVAPGGRLKGVLTDSDIRKFILRGGDLSAPASEAVNYSPKSLPLEKRADAQDFMRRHLIDALPLLHADGVIADVVFLNSLRAGSPQKALRTPVVVMAGGLGTRLYPYTKILPKPLIPVGEVPIVERVLQKFASFGCDAFYLLVNYRKNMLKSYFADLDTPYPITWVEEEEPLGTGGGLSLLKGRLDKPFFLTNCDILIDADYANIFKFHQKEGHDLTMVCATKQYTIPYGVVQLDEQGAYRHIDEKPCMNFLTNTGMYLVNPGVLPLVKDGVPQGFPDIIEACRQSGLRVGVYPVGDAAFMDMGQMEELEEMRRRFEQA